MTTPIGSPRNYSSNTEAPSTPHLRSAAGLSDVRSSAASGEDGDSTSCCSSFCDCILFVPRMIWRFICSIFDCLFGCCEEESASSGPVVTRVENREDVEDDAAAQEEPAEDFFARGRGWLREFDERGSAVRAEFRAREAELNRRRTEREAGLAETRRQLQELESAAQNRMAELRRNALLEQEARLQAAQATEALENSLRAEQEEADLRAVSAFEALNRARVAPVGQAVLEARPGARQTVAEREAEAERRARAEAERQEAARIAARRAELSTRSPFEMTDELRMQLTSQADYRLPEPNRSISGTVQYDSDRIPQDVKRVADEIERMAYAYDDLTNEQKATIERDDAFRNRFLLFQDPIDYSFLCLPIFDASHPEILGALRGIDDADVAVRNLEVVNNRDKRHVLGQASFERKRATVRVGQQLRNWGQRLPAECHICRQCLGAPEYWLIDTALQVQVFDFLREVLARFPRATAT